MVSSVDKFIQNKITIFFLLKLKKKIFLSKLQIFLVIRNKYKNILFLFYWLEIILVLIKTIIIVFFLINLTTPDNDICVILKCAQTKNRSSFLFTIKV